MSCTALSSKHSHPFKNGIKPGLTQFLTERTSLELLSNSGWVCKSKLVIELHILSSVGILKTSSGMVWLRRGNKGIIEIINIKGSKNETRETQKEHRAHPGIAPGCGVADTAGFPLQMFSCRVFGKDQGDLDFYRNPQQHDVTLPRSAEGKQQTTGDFDSLTSNSISYSMDYDPFSLRKFLKRGENSCSEKDEKMANLHPLTKKLMLISLKLKLCFSVSPFWRKLLNQWRFLLALICVPPWQKVSGTNPCFIPWLVFVAAANSEVGEMGQEQVVGSKSRKFRSDIYLYKKQCLPFPTCQAGPFSRLLPTVARKANWNQRRCQEQHLLVGNIAGLL